MRKLPIAYGNSCYAKTWTNKIVSFDDLCDRLSKTIHTTETIEEYPKLKKGERDRIKDKGGFVGGHLKENRRRRENVVSRSMLTLDVDHITPSLLDSFEKRCQYAACLYTTHGHTFEEPRARIIVPLTRDVSTDEYIAIARYLADSFGIDQFDECSYRPHQLMYWPTTPSNGLFIFKRSNGSWLDPDTYLAIKPHWRDFSLLPTSSRESMVRRSGDKKPEDPLAKEGIVGAFCRSFSIHQAIERFLLDIYKPSIVEGRYDYCPADSTAGLVVYDDRYAYSHHATDPAAQKLLNSFDLVRVHLYGSLDGDQELPITRTPSFQKMIQLCLSTSEVKTQLAQERSQQAGQEFSLDGNWQEHLELDKRGNVKDTLDNLVLIMRCDENLKQISLNQHTDMITCRGPLPWKQAKPGWSDTDLAALRVYLSKVYGLYSPNKTKDAVAAVATERAFDPVREYLDSLPPWDNIGRVETLLSRYFGAEDTPYTRAVARKMLVAAVARVHTPGTKFDQVPIIVGPQGIGKSTFFARLGGQWFSDSLTLTDMKDKSGPEKLLGYWILELGELAGMRKADIETVKSFISRTDDKYRASYGVNVESHLRQCIIVGTTNAETGFLRDITGNRRFWPVQATGNSEKKPWQLTTSEVEQIWAEALVLYHRGETLFLEGEEARLAEECQNAAMESDEREGIIRTFLDTLLPENWDEMDLGQRRDFLHGFGSKGTVMRTKVCNMEIWTECYGKDPAMMRKVDSYEIAAIMHKMDTWQKGERATLPIYGRQRYYKRDERV